MTDKTIIADQKIADIIIELKRVREYREEIKKQEEYLTQLLYNLVNEHEEIITVDENGIPKTIATWKYSKDSKKFNAKLFKELQPDVYASFEYTQPGSRTLRISK